MHTQASRPTEASSSAIDALVGGALSRRRRYIWLVVLAAGPLTLLILRLNPALDRVLIHDPFLHLVITLIGSLLGVFLALLVLNVARRAQDGRVFLIGMGFLSAASIFITHSISTPDVLMSGRGLATGISGLVSLVLGGVFFALSALPVAPGLNQWFMRHIRLWLLGFLVFWLVYIWVFLVTIPAIAAQEATSAARQADATGSHVTAHTAGRVAESYGLTEEYAENVPAQPPLPSASFSLLDLVRGLIVTIGFGSYSFAIGRHYSFYRRSRSHAGFGLTCGMVLFGEALLSQYFAQLYALSFWLYHIQEFTGYAVISYAVLGAYRRGLNDESLLESLLLPGTRARLQAGYARAMEALLDALSRGQQPTPALREALRARFGLAESQVRVLEEAAMAVAQERRQRQELELLNQSLRQLEAHKDQLTQMIVHDLKNPLTALIGFLELLRLDRLTEDQRVLLENALRSGKNLSDLIGDLLDIGRIEEGRLELQQILIAPCDLLVECAAEMRGWLAQENKTLVVEAPTDLPPLYADYRLMRRVLLNLLSNAIKHTPLGTHIALRAAPHRLPASPDDRASAVVSEIVIEVEDNGPGIPSIYLERIFDKFGRFSTEQPALQSSTGLGLTLCRLVVEAHGGTISVASVVGQGTIFRVGLPRATAS
ncbi:MAG TPA: HAMP domain-containing sensor histidine kinase [Roseiflexaceae bacterium]|nr:HAMP domain-containing sensor histidine kinase [Roseiflexaceae bacterium]